LTIAQFPTFINYISAQLLWITALFVFGAFCLSLAGVWLSKKIAEKYKILDDPKARPDKLQHKPIPFLGGSGFALVCTVLISLLWLINKYDWFNLGDFLNQNLYYPFRLYWIIIAIFILLVGGFLDDKFTLSSKWLMTYIFTAIFIAVFGGGLKIEVFSYPFDIFLPTFGYLPQVLAFVWILLCVSATKFLDGADGLASTAGLIALLSIASVSLFQNVYQPLIFLFALIWASGIVAFLGFNFPNAKVYLGEAGSEIIGFVIGVLAILSGAKVATATTVIGWFILDVVFVFTLRLLNKKPLFKADRTHWHHRLIDLGFSKIQVLAITALILLITAHTGLLFPTQYKVFVLLSQSIFLIIIFGITVYLGKRKVKLS